MQLTARTTETLVRRLASASKEELDQCVRDIGTMKKATGQPARVKTTCTRLARCLTTMGKDL